jgi:hypothetical protein
MLTVEKKNASNIELIFRTEKLQAKAGASGGAISRQFRDNV